MKKGNILSLVAGAVALAMAGQSAVAEDFGNRYNKPRSYAGEISASDAYMEMMQNKRVVIDVRTLREYSAGHAERAFNVPYPNIVAKGDQDPAVFYWEVYNVVNGKTDTPIATLCRTGSRSVDAANVLADPVNNGVPGGIPFTNVRNIWEGFVGGNLYGFLNGVPDPNLRLDLNNDGVINTDTADVYVHTTDANPDKDGWRNFARLPWTTQIQKPLAYRQNDQQYMCWKTDEGCS